MHSEPLSHRLHTARCSLVNALDTTVTPQSRQLPYIMNDNNNKKKTNLFSALFFAHKKCIDTCCLLLAVWLMGNWNSAGYDFLSSPSVKKCTREHCAVRPFDGIVTIINETKKKNEKTDIVVKCPSIWDRLLGHAYYSHWAIVNCCRWYVSSCFFFSLTSWQHRRVHTRHI